MKTHGILFKGEMVRAIQQNLKTQTRRLQGLDEVNKSPGNWYYEALTDGAFCFTDVLDAHLRVEVSPKYRVGDVLWVRETSHDPKSQNGKIEYRADWLGHDDAHERTFNWTPSILMPKTRARFWLEVTDVRCERVVGITPNDCASEGVIVSGTKWDHPSITNQDAYDRAIIGVYKDLWNSINGQDSWDKNPWVLAYTFKRIEKPI